MLFLVFGICNKPRSIDRSNKCTWDITWENVLSLHILVVNICFGTRSSSPLSLYPTFSQPNLNDLLGQWSLAVAIVADRGFPLICDPTAERTSQRLAPSRSFPSEIVPVHQIIGSH